MDDIEHISQQVTETISFLLSEGHIGPGGLIVLGCSTSEVVGGHIGKAGSPEVGQVIASTALSACAARSVFLAVQCCEHLNRALVMPRKAAEARGYAPVFAVPHPRAGGACASAYYRLLEDPVVVESILAEAGLDIGDTLIGMHLQHVAVPLRSPVPAIGQAHLVMAYTRPKYIGGPRARYTLDE